MHHRAGYGLFPMHGAEHGIPYVPKYVFDCDFLSRGDVQLHIVRIEVEVGGQPAFFGRESVSSARVFPFYRGGHVWGKG